jgi:hypothetical protein
LIGDSRTIWSVTKSIRYRAEGWAGIKNGDLLALAEKEFDTFVTVDRKLASQQDLTKFRIAVLLIRARTNRLEHIRPLAAEVLEKLPHATRGALTVIGT